ncbi:MAG: DUF4398 domain-containing protein [Acidobacteria bacterium]|nr:DUF4398 domain-containing protein [Acidobacteriota bacterium]
MRALPAVLLPLVLLAACSAPPQKEIDLAQGALDAARAAGAEQYAGQEYTAATAALQQAHDAVGQRDYRLALTRALDAHDRAQGAAKGAADGKARARGDAEAAIAAASAAITQIHSRMEATATAKLPPRELAAARRTVAAAQAAVQKARAAITSGHFLAAKDIVKDVPAAIRAQIVALDGLATKRTVKPPRRTR